MSEQVCSIGDCQRPVRARGWCVTHYARWSKHGDPTRTIRTYAGPDCEAPGCDKPADQGRYCGRHRARLTRLGVFELPARDRRAHSAGYALIKRAGHPLAQPNGWIYEHRAVLYDAIGPGVHDCHHCGMPVSWERVYPEHSDGLVVDHLDEDKTNNDPANLVPSCAVCNILRSNRWAKR